MPRNLIFLICIFFCINTFAQQKPATNMNGFITGLMNKMTIEEKIGQLNLLTIGIDVTGPVLSKDVEANIKKGYVGAVLNTRTPSAVRKLQDMAVKTRLGIPLFFGLDVIHGHTTMFPIPLALASSWDMPLIEHTARIAAEESAADGLNWTYSPMVDIARDPRWGRISEGAGEDPYLGSLIAKAMVKGYQGNDLGNNSSIMACVKHFALYGAAEAGRDYNTVDMSKNTMYNIYLPPYKAAVDAGVGSVMTSFNEIDGIPSTGNKWLLTDLLRNDWNFKGFVVTDYTAINEMMEHGMGDLDKVTELAMKAGVDMDMVGEAFQTRLKKLVDTKIITQNQIDLACRRVLEAKYKMGLFTDPYKNLKNENAKDKIFTVANRLVAKEAALHSIVLLKNNNNVLPLKRSGTIALIGPLADNKRDMFGPHGAAGDWKQNVSVLEGLKKITGINVLYAKGANMIEDSMLVKRLNADGGEIKIDPASQLITEAIGIANKSDVIVAVMGESQGMSGEAASRSDIRLPESQRNLLKALAETGKPIVLVIMNGRPLALEWEDIHVSAIVEAWFAGTEAGNAIADVLAGNYNPSAKITVSFPYNMGQVPIYYNHKNTGRPYKGDEMFKYASRYLDVPNKPLYPFGHGLSYTTYSYSDIRLDKKIMNATSKIQATVTVSNTGNVDGEETVQCYIQDLVGSTTRPVKELKAYKKIFLKKGESKEITFTISNDDLKFYNSQLKYVSEMGDFKIFIGTSSDNVKEATFRLL